MNDQSNNPRVPSAKTVAIAAKSTTPSTGSLKKRMTAIAAVWISILLFGGGFALERVLTNSITNNFDRGLEYVLTAMIRSAEIDPFGDVRLVQELSDQRFLEPASGLYWQINGKGKTPFPSRSLWDRTLDASKVHAEDEDVLAYNSDQFAIAPPYERLRVLEREAIIPGSSTTWRFQVAQNRESLDKEIQQVRYTLVRSFAALGLGLMLLAGLQIIYGLRPLRRISDAIADMRLGKADRVATPLPNEVQPLVHELNALIDHNAKQAEEARTHAGNLAHALKTPLTVIRSASAAKAPDLTAIVQRETATMQRQIDHHLARARAIGRRGSLQARAAVWASAEGVERAVQRLYPLVRIESDGDKSLYARVERQDLDEMLGNLVDNAAKYGGGTVFVTLADTDHAVRIDVEDDGPGIAPADRVRLFDRGVRLDSGKPGTGLGLAIVRDVAELYGGSVILLESEELGGLCVRLTLPKAG
jgi:signal transduction histidine kinase